MVVLERKWRSGCGAGVMLEPNGIQSAVNMELTGIGSLPFIGG